LQIKRELGARSDALQKVILECKEALRDIMFIVLLLNLFVFRYS